MNVHCLLFLVCVHCVLATKRQAITSNGIYGNTGYGVGAAAGYAPSASTVNYSCRRMVCKSWAVFTNHTINNVLLSDGSTGLLQGASDNGYGSTGYRLDSPGYAVAVQNNLVNEAVQIVGSSESSSLNAHDNRQKIVKVYGKVCWQYQCAHRYYHQGLYDYGPSYYAYYEKI